MARYAIVTTEELNAVRLETTDSLEIEQFVATADGGKGGCRHRAV
jgi:non-homologous end joining protein Ku